MTSRKQQFEHKRVMGQRLIQKHLEQGWEIVDAGGNDNWFWGTKRRALMRRPNPKYRPPKK